MKIKIQVRQSKYGSVYVSSCPKTDEELLADDDISLGIFEIEIDAEPLEREAVEMLFDSRKRDAAKAELKRIESRKAELEKLLQIQAA